MHDAHSVGPWRLRRSWRGWHSLSLHHPGGWRRRSHGRVLVIRTDNIEIVLLVVGGVAPWPRNARPRPPRIGRGHLVSPAGIFFIIVLVVLVTVVTGVVVAAAAAIVTAAAAAVVGVRIDVGGQGAARHRHLASWPRQQLGPL
jgi:hypothetical protein